MKKNIWSKNAFLTVKHLCQVKEKAARNRKKKVHEDRKKERKKEGEKEVKRNIWHIKLINCAITPSVRDRNSFNFPFASLNEP